MIDPTPKTTSVDSEGKADGFVPPTGWFLDVTPHGTRLVASMPVGSLLRVHTALVTALHPPLSFRYIQSVDRTSARPGETPERHFVALDLPLDHVIDALQEAADLIYSDGRCAVAIRGKLGEVVVLDEDGVLYTYPDDPMFRDALVAQGISEGPRMRTLADVDYPMRHFHAENDNVQARLFERLKLTEIAPH